jgi:hypothetical protein
MEDGDTAHELVFLVFLRMKRFWRMLTSEGEKREGTEELYIHSPTPRRDR